MLYVPAQAWRSSAGRGGPRDTGATAAEKEEEEEAAEQPPRRRKAADQNLKRRACPRDVPPKVVAQRRAWNGDAKDDDAAQAPPKDA